MPWVPTPKLNRPGMVVAHACNHNIQGVETVESEAEDHGWLLSGFEDSMSYMRLHLKKKKKKAGQGEREEEEKGEEEEEQQPLPCHLAWTIYLILSICSQRQRAIILERGG